MKGVDLKNVYITSPFFHGVRSTQFKDKVTSTRHNSTHDCVTPNRKVRSTQDFTFFFSLFDIYFDIGCTSHSTCLLHSFISFSHSFLNIFFSSSTVVSCSLTKESGSSSSPIYGQKKSGNKDFYMVSILRAIKSSIDTVYVFYKDFILVYTLPVEIKIFKIIFRILESWGLGYNDT